MGKAKEMLTLILDDFFEERGWRVPGDLFHLHKPDREPVLQLAPEIIVQ